MKSLEILKYNFNDIILEHVSSSTKIEEYRVENIPDVSFTALEIRKKKGTAKEKELDTHIDQQDERNTKLIGQKHERLDKKERIGKESSSGNNIVVIYNLDHTTRAYIESKKINKELEYIDIDTKK